MRISDGISDVCFSDLPVPHDMADLVARRLARPDGVAIDLALAAAAGDAGSGDEIIGRLLAAPALGVKARVAQQAGRPEPVRMEHTGPTPIGREECRGRVGSYRKIHVVAET